jgi:Eukaryotic protein of unknown function (DUF953)
MQITREKKIDSRVLHHLFIRTWKDFAPNSWNLAIFEGSPENGLYSWCPDCIVASSHIAKFESLQKSSKGAKAKLLKFHVGSRKEWNSKENVFRKEFPHLSDLPTSILFYGKIDVFRIIAPQATDLEMMISRIRIYEEQIDKGEWHVPTR